MNVLGFAGSNSTTSINKRLVAYVLSRLENTSTQLLDLNDFESVIYSKDRELETGVPKEALAFAREIDQADLLIISLAEHNGSYSAAFKNLLDWVSRIKDRKAFAEKPVFLMSASPGKLGGKFVMEAALMRFPRMGAEIIDHFSLPSFNDNFNSSSGINHEELAEELDEKLKNLKQQFSI